MEPALEARPRPVKRLSGAQLIDLRDRCWIQHWTAGPGGPRGGGGLPRECCVTVGRGYASSCAGALEGLTSSRTAGGLPPALWAGAYACLYGRLSGALADT